MKDTQKPAATRVGDTTFIKVILRTRLGEHATRHEVAAIEESPFGTRYVVDGIMSTPDGREPRVRSVWFIEAGESVPRFVTAYPLRRSST